MRDAGLELAIKAAGGVASLARGIGIAQPSVSAWSRIPAERVLAVEALTRVNRFVLRPDLYGPSENQVTSKPEIDEIDLLRAAEYGLLSLLLGKAPDADTLKRVATLKGDGSDLGMAHIELASAAAATDDRAVSKEFFDLFIGLGRGELLPYASYYLTGFLHERPLARVREDLDALGIERAGPSREPEDHVAILLEVMAGLARGDFEADFARTGAVFRAPSQALGGADVRGSGDVAIGALLPRGRPRRPRLHGIGIRGLHAVRVTAKARTKGRSQ